MASRVLHAFDKAHNPTQLAAEMRAAGLDAYVSDQQPHRFWVNAANTASLAAIQAVVDAHEPTLSTEVQEALDQKQDAITPGENIPAPEGAATDQDDEARAAIVLILTLLEGLGLMAAAEPEE